MTYNNTVTKAHNFVIAAAKPVIAPVATVIALVAHETRTIWA
jgi:hypothetical protein